MHSTVTVQLTAELFFFVVVSTILTVVFSTFLLGFFFVVEVTFAVVVEVVVTSLFFVVASVVDVVFSVAEAVACVVVADVLCSVCSDELFEHAVKQKHIATDSSNAHIFLFNIG